MPSIPLTDKFGLTADAQLAPSSALLKYAKQLTSLRLDSIDLSHMGGLTLDQPALTSLTSGVSFQDPIALGAGAATLTVAAGVSGSVKLITDPAALPGGGDGASVAAGACYLAFSVDASASAAAGATAGSLTFGVTPSTKLNLTSCSRFPLNAGITLLQATEQTVGAFAVCLNCDDLGALAPGQIAQATLSGALTLSAAVNLLAVTNPLAAAAALPAPLPAVAVSAGGSVTAGASFHIETDYAVTARRLDSGVVRLSWTKERGSSVTVTVAAAEGISAGTSGSDLLSQLLGAVSANPEIDAQELKAAALSAAETAPIEAAVQAAACRKLEIAAEAAFSTSASDTASFVYDIDPAALTAASRAAIDQALLGDLTGLHAPALGGVTCVRTLLDQIRKQDVALNVNLIGILNYRSVASLVLEGKVLYEAGSGELVISDTATAERIQTTQVNFGADADKLRRVLAESFLITAAYHGAGQGIGMPSLRCTQSFFALQASTGASAMAVKLRTGAALGLLTGGDAIMPAGIANFGRTLMVATADYDESLAQRLFLDADGRPLPVAAFETAGRIAIQQLVKAGDIDDVRLRPAVEDPLWESMKAAGQANIAGLFPGVGATFVGAIIADYSTIRWWADAMTATAQQLAGVRQWLGQHPTVSPDDEEYIKLRGGLAKFLRGVAANTRDEFGAPWGLLAIHQLAGPSAPASILITGPQLVRSSRRALTAETGAPA